MHATCLVSAYIDSHCNTIELLFSCGYSNMSTSEYLIISSFCFLVTPVNNPTAQVSLSFSKYWWNFSKWFSKHRYMEVMSSIHQPQQHTEECVRIFIMLPARVKRNYLVQSIKTFCNLLGYREVMQELFLSSSSLHVYKTGSQLL